MTNSSRASLVLAACLAPLFVSCSRNEGTSTMRTDGVPSAADSAFVALARLVIDDYFTRHPSAATDAGVHTYDEKLEDFSRSAVQDASAAAKTFLTRLAAVDTAGLSAANRADHALVTKSLEGTLLDNDVVQPWAHDPDRYSSGITNAAYVIIKRPYAPAADRLKALIARERAMPAALQEARRNLVNAPRIYTEIALDQIDGSISFFRKDVTAAFGDVRDETLLKTFRTANDSVVQALTSYKAWMQRDLLPKSTGNFAFGSDTYVKELAAKEMVDMPLARLLEIAEADRQKNEAAFQQVARQIDSTRSVDAVHASLELDHPPAAKLLATTQATLDSLRQFIISHHIITMPDAAPAQVLETPPFQRSTTSASMEIPGPFETARLEARYNMTLPDPRWGKAQQDDFMRQWYYAMISNVSVHEVYPGHYTQFLYAKQFPGDVRKVFGANSNVEGWAHYTEQMMLDEGFHAGDPKYRLAQLQDALLRDVRFIVGIRMHTQGMTVAEATKLFETAAHQPRPVAESEAKRGTSDALYGYYTLGKLMILKLRDDYKTKTGAGYSLQKFHDEFIRLGPLPLPLIRKAMLGETGSLL